MLVGLLTLSASACGKPVGEALWVKGCLAEQEDLISSPLGAPAGHAALCLADYKRMPPELADTRARWMMSDADDPTPKLDAFFDKREDLRLAFQAATKNIDEGLAGGEALPTTLGEDVWPEGQALDPWGKPWIYKQAAGKGEDGRDYELCSSGPDMLPDTADDHCASMRGSTGF